MSKWYEVPVTTYSTFAVEVEDNETAEDAVRCALDIEGVGPTNVEAMSIDGARAVECESPQEVKDLLSSADVTLSL